MDQRDITQLLIDWSNGDESAHEQLMSLVYDELHRLANRYLSREPSGHLLQATALVNEVYLRLIDVTMVNWQNRTHFFSLAAKIMRQILVDCARNRNADKRGSGTIAVTLDSANNFLSQQAYEITILNDVLETLAKVAPRQAQIVELRFFGGLSVEEIAEVLKINSRTVKRDWHTARAWLICELKRS